MKNVRQKNSILPLDKELYNKTYDKKNIAFIGAFAETPRYQGAGSSHINVEHSISALDYALNSMPKLNIIYAKGYEAEQETTNETLLQEALAAAKTADVAVVFAGLPESFESEGFDREHMRIPENQNILISEIAKIQKKTVVVLHGGSSMLLPWRHDVSAILHMHLGGDSVGKATVKLLFGDINPSGKLAESWPLQVKDNPSYLNFPGENGVVSYQEGIFIGYRYYDKKMMQVQYPFGYGLSYTTFEYSGLKIDKEKMSDMDKLIITVKIKNTGKCFGKEIVQLYTHMQNSRVRCPQRELKGFEKVGLKPGEEKEISFELDKRSFAYYEPIIHDWFLERGDAIIEIGASSRDIRISQKIAIDSQMELPLTITRYTILEELMSVKKGRDFMEGFMAKMGMAENSRQNLETEKQNEKNKETDDAMGAGSKKARMQMMFEMPLGSLVSYGIMDDGALENLIKDLNT